MEKTNEGYSLDSWVSFTWWMDFKSDHDNESLLAALSPSSPTPVLTSILNTAGGETTKIQANLQAQLPDLSGYENSYSCLSHLVRTHCHYVSHGNGVCKFGGWKVTVIF